MRVPVLRTTVVALLLAMPAIAQDHPHPRRAGERLGTVHFETSCAVGVAPDFDRGMALLHSFEFGDALRAFGEVLAADSTCAMAHWGIAMSRWSNPTAAVARPLSQLEAGRNASRAAARLAARGTRREQAYIAAVGTLYADFERVDQRARVLNYERAMGDVAQRFADDPEARVFHALALLGAADPTDKQYVRQLRAGSILEALWTEQPEHPGLAHYIIHAYDIPALADRARAAAQRYSQVAPSAAHALHMPSHTFTRVGLWQESVETNARSFDVAERNGAIAEALHALDYAAYANLQLRRDSAALAAVRRLPALAARFDPLAVTGAAPGWAGVFALAAIPARYALERRDWQQAAQLTPARSDFPWTEGMVYFARALGLAHTGQVPAARTAVDSLSAIQARLVAARESYWAEQVKIQQLAASAWLEHVSGRDSVALELMREAARREAATEKSAVTPGPLAPARELLGDLLLAIGRPAEALVEYRKGLENEPNRYRTLDGAVRAARASGDAQAAALFDAQLRKLLGR